IIKASEPMFKARLLAAVWISANLPTNRVTEQNAMISKKSEMEIGPPTSHNSFMNDQWIFFVLFHHLKATANSNRPMNILTDKLAHASPASFSSGTPQLPKTKA